ncbi:class I SAM-dependent DNA methyltransferase [Aquabacterium sp. OR-4]|uniref:class I SAM-dependent DNA methyltransferase n=1 Tax=Aquabacterium sp. OR-4 TaxID=2978127 RepID=UPI0021B16E35|nr:type I restriction-modification system subunit M [Aquabacterium sp. OR-4]MDT7834791.1 type I restriction-modification system subunit M [Aquabacterium sp. OR-4]
MSTHNIVQKLWSLCDILRDDGITYHQYVTELTLLLFLKMAQETDTEHRLPAGQRWADLKARNGIAQLDHYRSSLLVLSRAAEPSVAAIYAGSNTSIKEPRHLAQLVESIDALDWYTARTDGLGDLYEGLLEKNAGETKSGAGQYFTPRALIRAMVEVLKPQPSEVVQDPAAGTAGFLIEADRYIKQHTDDLFTLTVEQQKFQRQHAFVGMELVPDTQRLALMNCLLHDITGAGQGPVRVGSTLSGEGESLPPADLILANPPFGTKKGGGLPTRGDFTYPTSNKQLAFLQHIYRGLNPGGRAGVVLPDNVLFEGNVGRQIRADLMDKCRLHTILRLPTGIFYAQGVKTNVLFFEKGRTPTGNTHEVWVYDLRANMPQFGKRTPFTLAHLQPFITAYGERADGSSPRTDEGEAGRLRRFSREEIRARDDSLDIAWLKDDSAEDAADLPEPAALAQAAMQELEHAMTELEAILAELGAEVDG